MAELYDLFRANSCDGDSVSVHLYLPTDKGIYSVCNQDEQETELLNANINAFEPLSTFGIGKQLSAEARAEAEERAAKEADREARKRALAGKPQQQQNGDGGGGGGFAASLPVVSEREHGPYAKHPPVPVLYYPWYATIEVRRESMPLMVLSHS